MVASANSWVKFFQAAGVPSAAAATYAHIFYENRMDLDMLTDLNKEYLREMGITPMGDIISILRHAKKVNEQNMREKILSEGKLAVNTASVFPLVATSSKQSVKVNQSKAETESARKPPRRVLPEHEGRYKITLPSGSTERSKQILAKKAMLYADKETQKRTGIFDRLEKTKPGSVQRIEITGLNNLASSSIFSRLGGKSEDIDQIDDRAFAGILKSAPQKQIVSIKKATKPQQKAILVKRIPAKAATMIADEYEERMDTGEKSVTFSSTDEILEIETRKPIAVRSNRIRLTKAPGNIRARLGLTTKNDKSTPNNALLHRTKKVIKMKQPVKRANGQTLNVSTLRADEVQTSVKNRLSLKRGPEVGKLVNRIGRVTIDSRLGAKLKNGTQKLSKAAASSVFDRLGFNKK